MTVSPSLAEVIALLPCPFCGCKPELFRGRNRSRVACTTKRCKVQPVGLSVHPFTKAIAAWNGRRAAPEVGDNRAAFVNGYMECAHRHVMASTPISAIEHHARISADAAGYDATSTSAASLRDEEWLPIESAPQKRKVLLGYHNKLGNWRTVVGIYYPANTLEIDEYAGNWDDLDDYAPAGWYESTETHEHVFRTDEDPTHWQPLPKPPTQPAAQERQA